MQPDLFGDDPRDDPLSLPSPCGMEPPAVHPPGLWVGTCAWQHPDWDGHFYPAALPKAKQLAYYARFHNAVEVDSSFYRVPSAASVDRWRAETPDPFLFALKAPQTLTHNAALSLDNEAARRDWDAFLAAVQRLGALQGRVCMGPVSMRIALGPLHLQHQELSGWSLSTCLSRSSYIPKDQRKERLLLRESTPP